MTDVFSAALADLIADDNLSVPATFTPAAGVAVSLRVMKPLARPLDFNVSQGHSGGAAAVKFVILQSALSARPARNDTLTVGSQIYTVESSVSSADGLLWTLDVRPLVTS